MKKISEREYKYQAVVKELVKRYIMKQQKRDRNAAVTEDDLNEIKQDISGLRYIFLFYLFSSPLYFTLNSSFNF